MRTLCSLSKLGKPYSVMGHTQKSQMYSNCYKTQREHVGTHTRTPLHPVCGQGDEGSFSEEAQAMQKPAALALHILTEQSSMVSYLHLL